MSDTLTHFNQAGQAHMVDVSIKPETHRRAMASGQIRMMPSTFEKLTQGDAKKGDVLVWHANLLHGGMPVVHPALTRKSMVAHYFAEGVICYHEISQRPAVM